jgi:hypothetical protein
VEIATDVKHGCLQKSLDLGTAATAFQVIRRTRASFRVSTPKRAGRLADASVDPTDARGVQFVQGSQWIRYCTPRRGLKRLALSPAAAECTLW